VAEGLGFVQEISDLFDCEDLGTDSVFSSRTFSSWTGLLLNSSVVDEVDKEAWAEEDEKNGGLEYETYNDHLKPKLQCI
jgi:hypothetical protein